VKKLLFVLIACTTVHVFAYRAYLFNSTNRNIQFSISTDAPGCYAGQLSGGRPCRVMLAPNTKRLFNHGGGCAGACWKFIEAVDPNGPGDNISLGAGEPLGHSCHDIFIEVYETGDKRKPIKIREHADAALFQNETPNIPSCE
jgi:hypothetical protein